MTFTFQPLNAPAGKGRKLRPGWDRISDLAVIASAPDPKAQSDAFLSHFRATTVFTKEAQRIATEKYVSADTEMHEWSGLLEWMKSDPANLERPTDSLWHKLRDFMQLTADATGERLKRLEPQIFLVQHDWASAFAGASDFDGGECPLPYEFCAFEFVISGRRVIVLARDLPNVSVAFIQMGSRWWSATDDSGAKLTLNDEFEALIARNIRAVCIALDAEVAVTEIVRAPHRLNVARMKRGKLPISDHHIVNLTKRSRVAPLPVGEHEARWHPRLHFRRGHWRHYETHKTWIKWMLVGDPDLGFIDKHYRA